MATTALLTLGAFVSAAPSTRPAGRPPGLAAGRRRYLGRAALSPRRPDRRRGALISVFQLMVTIGILLAYGNEMLADRVDGWRFLLAAGVPGLVLSGLALFRQIAGWLAATPVGHGRARAPGPRRAKGEIEAAALAREGRPTT